MKKNHCGKSQLTKYVLLWFIFLPINASAENYFTKPLKNKGIHFLIETEAGYSHYSSPGGLYETGQAVYYATGILGYDIKSLFLGIRGTACRHTEEYQYSFRAFLDVRYSIRTVPLTPYGEILGGVVGYLKWMTL